MGLERRLPTRLACIRYRFQQIVPGTLDRELELFGPAVETEVEICNPKFIVSCASKASAVASPDLASITLAGMSGFPEPLPDIPAAFFAHNTHR